MLTYIAVNTDSLKSNGGRSPHFPYSFAETSDVVWRNTTGLDHRIS